jgi:hypothetical protein
MADSWLIMAVKVKDRSAADLKSQFYTGTMSESSGVTGRLIFSQFVDFVRTLLRAIRSGVNRGNVYATILDTSGTLPAGNVACTQANAAGNYVRFTYGAIAVTLTEGVDFDAGASDTTCAANLAAAINAHPALSKLFTALAAVGDCAVTAKIPTALLQDFAITTDDATAFTITALTGGTEGAAQFLPTHFSTSYEP